MNYEGTSKKLFKRRNTETEVWGDEPEVKEITEPNSSALNRIYNWYNYFHDKEDGVKWILTYMKKNRYDQKDIDAFSRYKTLDCSLVRPIWARMLTRGTMLPVELIDQLHHYIMNAINHVKAEEAYKKSPVENLDVPGRNARKVLETISLLEDCLDYFVISGYEGTQEKSFYEILTEENVKTSQAKEIRDYYAPLLEEIKNIENDEDLKYAYRNLSKKQKNNYLNYISKLISDIDRVITNESVVKIRKPRKKKEIDRSQVVKNVKYKKEDKDLKLISMKPESIIGTTQVWLYNVKYKVIRRLETTDPKGLSIRGTTVVDFMDTLSRAKSVRKPAEVLAEILVANKARLKKFIDEFKGSDYPLTGRINEDTIILRTFK